MWLFWYMYKMWNINVTLQNTAPYRPVDRKLAHKICTDSKTLRSGNYKISCQTKIQLEHDTNIGSFQVR